VIAVLVAVLFVVLLGLYAAKAAVYPKKVSKVHTIAHKQVMLCCAGHVVLRCVLLYCAALCRAVPYFAALCCAVLC